MLNRKIYPQSSMATANNIRFISLIIVGCTSSNISQNVNDGKEIMENLKVKPSSTRSNKKEIFSLNEIISNKKTLENLKKLENGWNGYDAEPINKNIIESVADLIVGLDRQPKIFPTGRGTIQIEFSNENDYLEIEVSNSLNSFFEQKNNQESEGNILIERINDKVNEFFS